MKRLGKVDTDVRVTRLPDDEQLGGLHWRTRIEMIADDDGKPSMRRRGTHRRVALDTMPLATQSVLDAAQNIGFFDGGFTPGAQLRIAVPHMQGDSGETDNFALMVDGELKAGEYLLSEQVNADGHTWKYRVNADGFWQVHRLAPSTLVTHVLHSAQDALDGASSACIWDLYSGAGLFTLALATAISERTNMLSIEGSKPAVVNARRNLRSLDLSRVDARIGDVGAVLGNVPSHLSKPGVVVLDPPRAGARKKVCERIAQAHPRAIIYVACDPTSLARDTATLAASGYTLRDLKAYDIYPMTHHVESVAVFTG